MNKDPLLLILLVIFFLNSTFSQENKTNGIQLLPYAGVNLPQGDFKDFSDNGAVFGLAADKYLSKRFALGIDAHYLSNPFSSPFDYTATSIRDNVNSVANSDWTSLTFLVGPTYRLGGSKINAEVYAKAGVSMIESPNQSVAFSQIGVPDISLLEIKEGNTTSLAYATGVRFNYAISDQLSVFVNPQYLLLDKEIEYFHRPITSAAVLNPELLAVDGGNLCFVRPAFLNVNFGMKFNFGGKERDSIKREEGDVNDQSNSGICNETKLVSPYAGETYFAESGITPEFEWINHSKPTVKSYVFELFAGEERLFEKKIKTALFRFSNKRVQELYNIEEVKDYSWRVITNYKDCESTTTEFNYFTVQPRNTANRSSCDFNITVDHIECDDVAYTASGKVRYTGTFTIRNNTSSLQPGILIPHPSALGVSQLFGTDNANATLNYYQNGMMGSSSPCVNQLLVTTPYGPGLPANTPSTYCFDLEVPIGTNVIKFYGNMNTYNGGDRPAECPEEATITLPTCSCDDCDTWDFTNQKNSYRHDANNNNPYISHIIRQSFKLPTAAPIRRMKAEIIYVKHEVNEEECYGCTTQVRDMGLFSTVSAKPRDFLADRLDWRNNNYGELGLDKNNDGFSNMLNWNARNLVTGVDFTTREHNFFMYINLPEGSDLDCCDSDYEVWIRYTFEDVNCVTCSTVVKYDLSGASSSGSGRVGTGIGTSIPDRIEPQTTQYIQKF